MKNILFFSIKNQGFSVIEAVIGATIAALLIITFSTLISKAIVINDANAKELKASLYVQELIEIAKDLEMSPELSGAWNSYLSLPACISPQKCHPEVSGSNWTLNSGEHHPDLAGVYTRSLTIEDEAVGVKKVTATIHWMERTRSRDLTIEAMLYNYSP
jgi:hypothetical protein